ncbi:transducin beta-like protein 3 [Teleopsis dalmanni]|uniref:transducin beta-like protein 3 n=1 Tax=Teleopsis dalmanni TaxID=139649 RepID=UPI0018CE72C2|nr:transducin beta-like protein 3 [Teleopsis dalmanni]
MTTNILEKSFAVGSRFSNFYAGGDVAWSKDGKHIYCLNSSEVCCIDVATGQVNQIYGTKADTIKDNESSKLNVTELDEVDEDIIYTFALASTNDYLVTAHRSGLIRLWSLDSSKIIKIWKSQHRAPVVKVTFSACGKLICTSGADSTLRVWDFLNSRCLCVLKDFQGPALLLSFHSNSNIAEIYAAGADNTIYCWNYETKALVRTLRGHISQVTGFCFENDNEACNYLVTASRDKVLIIWQLDTSTQYKTIPMFEELEGAFFLPSTKPDVQKVLVATTNGNLKLVSCKTGKIISLNARENYEIRLFLRCPETHELAIVTAEHNILIYKIVSKDQLDCTKQLIGFNDEILDLCFLGDNDRFLAVATNSKNIKIYDTESNMNCKIIAGHKDTVMALSATGNSNLLLSAGKDYAINVWKLDPDSFTMTSVASNLNGHTATIGCISFGFNSSSVFASVCQSGTLKVWNLNVDKKKEYNFVIKYSALAHEKEVNSVTFSPNNKMIATASQDKTAKLWSSETQAVVGTLRGHTRGVWCVRFSPVDQIALTSSSDCSLRIWSLANMSCLKRLEQECTALRAEFIDHGKYIVSSSSDGLIKIWSIKNNCCIQTLDEHTDRVWALAVSNRSKKYFYSGGADSKIVKWQDVTEENRNSEMDKRQAMVQEEQTLQSLLHAHKNMHKAFVLALRLDKPKTTYNILSDFIRNRNTAAIEKLITELNNDQRGTLLGHVKAWGTNSRHASVSNITLRYLLTDLIAHPNQRTYNTSNMVEVITPYTQRHFNRATELKNELCFLEFIVNCI